MYQRQREEGESCLLSDEKTPQKNEIKDEQIHVFTRTGRGTEIDIISSETSM